MPELSCAVNINSPRLSNSFPDLFHAQALFLLIVESIFQLQNIPMIDQQSKDAPKPKGLQGYLSLISQRAKIQGFIVYVVSPSIKPLMFQFSFRV
jgi:hypothetical protein